MEGSLGPVTATQCDHMHGATSPHLPWAAAALTLRWRLQV